MSTPNVSSRARATLPVAALTLVFAGCTDRAPQAELSAPRESSTPAASLEQPRSSAERLGVQTPTGAAPTAAPASTPSTTPTSGGNGALKWELPASWSELAPTSMRVANFRVAGDERAECYLTFLAGDGGGLAANIQRWRTQMGQSALSTQEIAALPTRSMLGGEAVLVDFKGSFSGMGGGAKLADARLVGLLLVGPQGAAFLKMTGPSSTIDGQVDAFLALAASLRN